MKKAWVMFFLLLLVPVVHGVVINDFNAYSAVRLDVELSSEFQMQPLSSNAKVESVSANLSFVPKVDTATEIVSLEVKSSPQAQVIKGEGYTYRWQDPTSSKFSLGYEGQVVVKNVLYPVKEKIVFPLEPLNSEFLQPTEFIDINPAIRQKAAELAAGEDDAYVVAFRVADWVEQNVKYDLNSVTAKAVQKSSWVLENKEGVCDELTNLFISMMRSLGIPARFVSGLAYTNLGHTWGPHGWAEVYLPGQGWVPFDVTYGQYGWIDPSHIKLKAAPDSGDPSLRFTWRAVDVKFKSEEVNLSAHLVDAGRKKEGPISVRVRPLIDRVGPGSFVPVEVTLTNPRDIYIPEGVVITKAPPLVEKNVKHVLVKPSSSEKLYWIVKIPKNVDPNFMYSTFVEVEDLFHETATTNISYSGSGKVIDQNEALSLIGASVGEALQGALSVSCVGKDHVFSYEALNVECGIKNGGDAFLRNVHVCLRGECQYVSLDKGETKKVKFGVVNLKPGLTRLEVTAEQELERAKAGLLVNVLNSPDLVLSDVRVPESIAYNDPFVLSFVMSVKAPVKDVSVLLNNQEVILLPTLDSSKKVVVNTYGREYVRNPTANVTINFKDQNGKAYAFSKSIPVQVEKVPFFVRLLLWLRIA